MSPMIRNNEEWLQREINKLTDKGKQVVGMILVVIDDINKKASTRK
jgi:hypothetical protein